MFQGNKLRGLGGRGEITTSFLGCYTNVWYVVWALIVGGTVVKMAKCYKFYENWIYIISKFSQTITRYRDRGGHVL